MQILVEVPAHMPDAAQCSPQQFMQDAKLAMAVKLFEMKRLSSGMAASLIGMSRVQFLSELHRFNVPMIDLDQLRHHSVKTAASTHKTNASSYSL
jgi:predicted HTH domain antitoxin